MRIEDSKCASFFRLNKKDYCGSYCYCKRLDAAALCDLQCHITKTSAGKIDTEKKPGTYSQCRMVFYFFPKEVRVIVREEFGHHRKKILDISRIFPYLFRNFSMFPSNNRTFRKNTPDIFWDSIFILFSTKLEFKHNNSGS
jgi:hypothetical protein